MKRLNIILLSLLALVFTCCNSDEFLTSNNAGYLTINISTVNSTNDKNSRTVPADYNPQQLAIEIVDNAGQVVEQTDDASMWDGQSLALKPGKYTVNVHSNNWDGNDSGRNTPFYAGSQVVTIATNVKAEANVVCTLANVKVSVFFDNSVADKFASAYVEVASAVDGILPQTFTMGNAVSLISAYFPVGNLTATLHVTNKAGVEYTKTTELTDVKARDHYMLSYSVESTGEGEFTVSATDNETTYTYNLYVPGDPIVSFNTTTKVNEWATFALVEGTIDSSSLDDIDDSKVFIQYKSDSSDTWTSVETVNDNGVYKATVKGLNDNTAYSARLAYVDGANEYAGTSASFRTEEARQLPNSGFEDWTQQSRLWYACSSADYSNNLFWGSSNVNAVVTQINGVTGSNDSHSGSKSASLQSKYVNVIGIKKFAAGSLYTGKMPKVKGTNGASIDFGREFTSRPSQFTGYFKYSTGAINQTGSYALPEGANIVKGTTKDLWSTYIVLMTEPYTFDNSSEAQLKATLLDYKSGNNPKVIAYGEMADTDCVEASDWTKFTVNMHYFDTTTKPAYLVLVMSSSKYGDYFTGCDSSLLLVDDISFVYDEPSF